MTRSMPQKPIMPGVTGRGHGAGALEAIGGALAYGTQTVPRVDKIVGPGNAYVACAKRLVFGAVDIDSIAGPSEILVVADDGADPRIIAADLLSQAEHDCRGCVSAPPVHERSHGAGG